MKPHTSLEQQQFEHLFAEHVAIPLRLYPGGKLIVLLRNFIENLEAMEMNLIAEGMPIDVEASHDS